MSPNHHPPGGLVDTVRLTLPTSQRHSDSDTQCMTMVASTTCSKAFLNHSPSTLLRLLCTITRTHSAAPYTSFTYERSVGWLQPANTFWQPPHHRRHLIFFRTTHCLSLTVHLTAHTATDVKTIVRHGEHNGHSRGGESGNVLPHTVRLSKVTNTQPEL